MTDSEKREDPRELVVDEDGELVFPCRYPIKAMTRTQDQALEQVVDAISAAGVNMNRDTIQIKPSRNGTFQSITIEVEAATRQQLEQTYTALRALDVVVMTL